MQALSGPASFLIAPGETYDYLFRPEQKGDLQLTLDLALEGEGDADCTGAGRRAGAIDLGGSCLDSQRHGFF